jgi:single-strand DNA-binding protein
MNDCKFTGRLTADPEVRTTQNGHRVVPFTLAVDRMKKGAGEQTQADFLRFEAWDNHADTIAKYCRKGAKLLISGAARAESYTDQNGNKRTKNFFLVRFLELPPKPPQSQQTQPSDQSQQIRKAPVDVMVTYDDDFAYYDEQDLPF